MGHRDGAAAGDSAGPRDRASRRAAQGSPETGADAAPRRHGAFDSRAVGEITAGRCGKGRRWRRIEVRHESRHSWYVKAVVAQNLLQRVLPTEAVRTSSD